MQFHLDTAELNLLAEVLMQETGKPSAEQLPGCDDLLNKVLARDMRLDSGELEQAGEVLRKYERALKEEMAGTQDPNLSARQQAKLKLMQRVREKVNEACVMF